MFLSYTWYMTNYQKIRTGTGFQVFWARQRCLNFHQSIGLSLRRGQALLDILRHPEFSIKDVQTLQSTCVRWSGPVALRTDVDCKTTDSYRISADFPVWVTKIALKTSSALAAEYQRTFRLWATKIALLQGKCNFRRLQEVALFFKCNFRRPEPESPPIFCTLQRLALVNRLR